MMSNYIRGMEEDFGYDTEVKRSEQVSTGIEADQEWIDFQATCRLFFDNRPLTDETLKELGFEKQGMIGMTYWEYQYSDEYYLVAKRDPNYPVPYVCGIEWCDVPVCKTVGSVRMLIEALKGDE